MATTLASSLKSPIKPTKTVEEICELIEKYAFVSSSDMAKLRARWFRADRKEAADAAQFCRWLVLNHYLTEFAAKIISGRKSAQLVLNEYRLTDQMISGPMAGAYLATDALDRHVAIEVLSANSAADKAALAKFDQAAKNAMKVDHINVGRILDTGEAHGFHYLVKEFYEGQTLDEILQRRKTMPYQQATRLMALALAGLDALHANGVPAGDLTPNCLLLTSTGKAANQRTVKLLNAGVKRKLFDATAIGRSISLTVGAPDELELADSYTFHVADSGAVNVADDLYRLGCIFYRTVVGRDPVDPRNPSAPPTPTCQANPEIPEMLGQIIDEMLAPNPEDRPKKAAHVAKSLRVFLAADEQSREPKAEENLALAEERAPAKAAEPVEEPEPEASDEEDEEAPTPSRKSGSATPDGPWGKLLAAWNEIKPEQRDLFYLAGGAAGILILILILQLLIGLHFVYIAGLLTGAAVSYAVDAFLQWRRQT